MNAEGPVASEEVVLVVLYAGPRRGISVSSGCPAGLGQTRDKEIN